MRTSLTIAATTLLILLTLYSAWRDQRWRPLHPLSSAETPLFHDTGNRKSLLQAARSQLSWLRQQHGALRFGGGTIDVTRLQHSLARLVEFLENRPTPDELTRFLHRHYQVLQAGGRRGKRDREMLVTAYYEPIFAGDDHQTRKARFPLYAFPQQLRGEEGQPRWSRRTLELSGRLAGSEVAWLNDPFDSYLLHVQGSGRIKKPDDTLLAVRYAGNNGHGYMSLGKLFVDEKLLPRNEVSIPAMRRWLRAHPQEQQRMFFHNPRYIFFKTGENGNPAGSNGVPLTPGRSAAIDPDVLPTGTLAVLTTRIPVFAGEKIVRWKKMTRLVFPQDQGAAIKGAGRIDLFLGNGESAEKAAQVMQEPGQLYFLLWRERPGSLN